MSLLTRFRGWQNLARGDTTGAIEKITNFMDGADRNVGYIVGDNQEIDAKTAGNTLIYTVPAGKGLIIFNAIIRSVTVVGPTANPFISMGTNATAYDNIIPNSQFLLHHSSMGYNVPIEGAGLSPYGTIHAAGTRIYLRVNTPAAGATFIVGSYLVGMLV